MKTIPETVDIMPESHSIDGVYGDRIIQVNSFKLPGNTNVVINIHGTFGSMNGGKDKYRNFAESLVNQGVSNVVLFASSRKNMEIDPNITDRYKQRQAKFIGKSFLDELEDVRRVLKDVIENSESRFGIKKEDLRITFNGNSLGGVIAFYLANEFSEVKNIVSVGTGLRLEIKDVPILDTFPNPEELKEKLRNFHGKYLMIYGTEDDVFTEQSFFDFINTVGSNEEDKSSIQLIGVDHTFGKVGGQESPLPYKNVANDMYCLLKEDFLVSGGENMLTGIDTKIEGYKSSVDKTLWNKHSVPDDTNSDELFFG